MADFPLRERLVSHPCTHQGRGRSTILAVALTLSLFRVAGASEIRIGAGCALPGGQARLSVLATIDAPLEAFSVTISFDSRLSIVSAQMAQIDGNPHLLCDGAEVEVDHFFLEEGMDCIVVGAVIDGLGTNRTCVTGGTVELVSILAGVSSEALPGDGLWLSLEGFCGKIPKETCLVVDADEGSRKICAPELQLADAAVVVTESVGLPSYPERSCAGEEVTIEAAAAYGADGYEIEYRRDGGPWQPVSSGLEPGSRFVIPDAGTYSFRVRGLCSGAAGSWMVGHELLALAAPPTVGSPIYAECIPPDRKVALAWDPVIGATEYVVEVQTDGSDWFPICSPQEAGCDVDAPEGHSTRVFRVAACNDCGCGPWVLGPAVRPCRSFIRGDANCDGVGDISDPVATLAYLFLGTLELACLDAADADDSGQLDVTDAIYGLEFLFVGGPPLPDPFPDCGFDPTPDDLACESFEKCTADR